MEQSNKSQFQRSFRGYDPAEVDAYIASLHARLADLEKENGELKAGLDSYRKQEGLLRAALLTAEEAAAKVREKAAQEAARAVAAAEKKAASILKEAEAKARDLEADAAAYREEIRKRLYAYEREARVLLDRFYGMARRHVEALEREFVKEVEVLLARIDAEYGDLPRPVHPAASSGRGEVETTDALAAEWEDKETAALLGRTLTLDLADPEGRVLARRGESVTPELIERAVAAGLYGDLVAAAAGEGDTGS
ncbi:hypothetical protein MTAT_16840 [Moorella thermoacetica]|uniref:Septum site-determining protein DivIVA n=1 Tax=Neomoorella thermoacetica TaxID=1525 RepID=A0AAC9HG09_NEOTH|nr:DivIVA domain-containing protein [Moorella thermoacetica]AOQ23154.1 Septum site-determining protein DivIVA [Moorella thermoacetica]TYL12861.1 hypothetical protein MTAT_16840 [Moorella thermoacetica]